MPICEVDPWRMQYFERVACPADVLISTEDADSLDLVPAPSLGLRQGRGRAEPGPRGRAARRRAESLSGLLQADHQPEGHGRRQPRAAQRRRLHDALRARPHVDDLARRPPRLIRRRGARRQAGVVAPRDRRARRRGHVRSLDAARRARRGDRIRLRRLDRKTSRRLQRHDQSRDHRRAHHRGASALRRPVAGPLRQGLGRGAGAALCSTIAGTIPTPTGATATASCCSARTGRAIAIRRRAWSTRCARCRRSRACRSPSTRTSRRASTRCRRAASGSRS